MARLNLNSMQLVKIIGCLERNSIVKIIGLWAKMLYDTLKMGGSLAQKKKILLITKAIEPMSVIPQKAPPFIFVSVCEPFI